MFFDLSNIAIFISTCGGSRLFGVLPYLFRLESHPHSWNWSICSSIGGLHNCHTNGVFEALRHTNVQIDIKYYDRQNKETILRRSTLSIGGFAGQKATLIEVNTMGGPCELRMASGNKQTRCLDIKFGWPKSTRIAVDA